MEVVKRKAESGRIWENYEETGKMTEKSYGKGRTNNRFDGFIYMNVRNDEGYWLIVQQNIRS
jgi:hypothetical protein